MELAIVTPTSTPEGNSPFVSRVSHLPLVNTALRAYEQGKASSRVVKVWPYLQFMLWYLIGM